MSDAPTDYVYDAFISYRRGPIVEEWLAQSEFFYPLLNHYLKYELPRTPNIFLDKAILKAGDKWASELELALRTSRCLLLIGTPDYFRSAWCSAEYHAFAERSAQFPQHDLIVPIAFHRWIPPPSPAAHLQAANFHDLAYLGLREEKNLNVRFQQTMKAFCTDLAEKIEKAPPFDPTWTVYVPKNDDGLVPNIQRPREAA